jgi:hypothetical protein
MSVDPTDPETFENDLDEVEEFDAEVPEADAAEQHADLLEKRDTRLEGRPIDTANPADAAEQARVVELHEDDYR